MRCQGVVDPRWLAESIYFRSISTMTSLPIKPNYDQIIEASAQYVSAPCAASMLGVDPKIIHQLCDSGQLKCIRPIKHRRIAVNDILEFISKRQERQNRRLRQPIPSETD